MRQASARRVVMGSACASRHNVALTFGVQPGPASLVRQARTTLGGLQDTGATSRNKKRNRAASGVKFNVQCSEPVRRASYPSVSKGLKELREFMDGLSAAQPMGATPFAPPPPPPQ